MITVAWNILGSIGAVILLIVVVREIRGITFLDVEEGVLALASWIRQHPCVYWMILLLLVVGVIYATAF